jgi:hypothetical protein
MPIGGRGQLTLVAGDPAPIAAAIQRGAWTLDPRTPRFEVGTLAAHE